MKLIDELIKEHYLISLFMAEMNPILHSQSICVEESYILDRVKVYIDFIKNYVDAYHHQAEEKILFKYMEESGTLTHCNPIKQMNYEHDLGRSYVKDMDMGVQHGSLKQIINSINNYEKLLTSHISKENNVLYPMAEKLLSPKVKNEMDKEFMTLQKNVGRENLHNHYVEILKSLKSKFFLKHELYSERHNINHNLKEYNT